MLVGRLRHIIEIERVDEVQDTFGGIDKVWNVLYRAYSAVEPLLGREYHMAGAERSESTTRFRMRYVEDITPKDRLVFDNTIYDIPSVVNHQERDTEVIVMAKERS